MPWIYNLNRPGYLPDGEPFHASDSWADCAGALADDLTGEMLTADADGDATAADEYRRAVRDLVTLTDGEPFTVYADGWAYFVEWARD